MKYCLSVLRANGSRLPERIVVCKEVRLESKLDRGFTVIQAFHYFDYTQSVLSTLYEPKILKWSINYIHLMGFETEQDGSHVQEWVLEDFKLGFNRVVVSATPQSRM